MHPKFELQPFQLQLIRTLDALERGALVNANGEPQHKLLINMPPRHGKSWIATELFPVYYLGRKPTREMLSISYSAELARKFGRSVRDRVRNEIMLRQIFPGLEMRKDSSAIDDWYTTAGGAYFATGVGGGTPGRAANLLIIDDPIKARKEADSATYRNMVWSYYTSTLAIRKQPDIDNVLPIEIVILTRWHPDDLAGRIMESPEWERGEWAYINFKGIELDESTNPPTEHALWPQRFPLEYLHRVKERNEREFASLYQQSPYIAGGNLIKTKWFRTYRELPELHTLIVAADTAFKKSTHSDYSVLMVLGCDRYGDIYIVDIVRGRYDFPELKRQAIITCAKWRGRGLRGLYIEDKASGQSLIQELRNSSGIAVIPHRTSTDKVTRVSSVLPLIEGGRVLIPDDAPWMDDFIAELTSFPSSAHDDQVDALTIGLDSISRISGTNVDFLSTRIDMDDTLTAHVSRSLTAPFRTAFAGQEALGHDKQRARKIWRRWGEL